MPKPIPSLGYKSRTEAAGALFASGKTIAEISVLIGVDEKTVSALLASGRRRKHRPSEDGRRTVAFPAFVLDRLRTHADRREITINELVRRVVETACDENIIDAILDDGERA